MQVLAEYTFEKASETPYVLMPFVFEPGREMLFRFTLLSDDRDDDGEPDFIFSSIKPEEDWKQACIKDAWHNGGKGNQFLKYNLPYQGSGATAGGDDRRATTQAPEEMPARERGMPSPRTLLSSASAVSICTCVGVVKACSPPAGLMRKRST